MRALLQGLAALLLGALAGCGGTVDVENQEASASTTAGSGGSGGGTTTGTGGQGGCGDDPGDPYACVQFCGSDFISAKECKNGAWTCPPGFVDASTCPPIKCGGLPLACEICGERGWECKPEPACLTTCDQLACAECPAGSPGPSTIGACSCSCDANGQYACSLAPGCCNTDMDCGDIVYVPCVSNVCKPTVQGGCWSDAECAPQKCIGAFVCPCGFDCDLGDQPGTCG